jgi:cellulose synthase/poly-beta-1,6-N-acetylglucosamine synthase-like glycosyltransferase
VRVLVSNDGSLDETESLAREAIAGFRHASGEILNGPNGGQAVALNRGLAATNAGLVVRIDADCVMGPDALVYCVPWFRDPKVGCVGAMEEPRTDTVTWFHRLRVLETLFQFRFARLGQSMVDGIVVIPGTFMAFRRDPAGIAGGFAVGMNGEDCDLTMQIGRRGYRVVIDPRVRSQEDVPRTVGEFVEQRTRWARAGFHAFARHDPFRSGSAGPRVWFWTMRRGFSWFSLQAGLVAPVFMLELVVTHPSYRQNVITFVLLYAAAGTLPLIVSLPLAVRHKQWRSIPWLVTWFAYAFLRRLATLEAVISLPVRPFPAPAEAWLPRGAGPRLRGLLRRPLRQAPRPVRMLCWPGGQPPEPPGQDPRGLGNVAPRPVRDLMIFFPNGLWCLFGLGAGFSRLWGCAR